MTTTDDLTRWVNTHPRTGSPPATPTKHVPLLGPEALEKRRKVLRWLTPISAGVAMFGSGWFMWNFFNDLPLMRGKWYVILPIFTLFDLAAVTCAVGARINRIAYGRMGVEGWLVWLFATTSGLMSASDATGRESAVRFAAPMVAAILFELLIRGERRDLTLSEGPFARVRRRVLARLGLLDDVDQDDESAARSRMAAKLATLAYRVHQRDEGSWRQRRAIARYHRKLRTASVRMGLATNDAMIDETRRHLNTLYRSISDTAPAAVAELNIWQSAVDEFEEPEEAVATNAQVAAPAPISQNTPPRVRIAPVRRPGRSARLAGRPRASKPAQPSLAPPAPVESLAHQIGIVEMGEAAAWRRAGQLPPGENVSALNGHARSTDVVRAPVNKPAKKQTRKKGAAATGDAFDRAFQFWQSEKAQGRTPSAQQIADSAGVSKATGGRYLQQLREVAS